jgi:predicted alpha/beta hydrolase
MSKYSESLKLKLVLSYLKGKSGSKVLTCQSEVPVTRLRRWGAFYREQRGLEAAGRCA